ncbi:hypothetical protein [Occallatibacter savannae]|uniref:hypothetical protein n=1 Tax=Occallatibacter savannae TaxID=1002691 RepID=UPI0013A567F3|nr:hypothetical protein [Occallatibacter savannae]
MAKAVRIENKGAGVLGGGAMVSGPTRGVGGVTRCSFEGARNKAVVSGAGAGV